MTGKRKWYRYTCDDGAVFAIDMDVSNSLIAGNVLALTGTRTLPRGIRPRFVTYSQSTGVLLRKIVLGRDVAASTLPLTFSEVVDGVLVVFRRRAITKEKEVKSTLRP
jgi:hypothetical protein